MDVGELLDFKLESKAPTKRSKSDKDGGGSGTKRSRTADMAPLPTEGNLSAEQREKLLRMVEDAEPAGGVMDESALRKLVLAFEKRVLKNQELRIKFPDMPAKFLESEVELHDVIQEMLVVATVPDLYQLLVDLQCVHTIVGLLGHENTDISCAIVGLIQELTDADTLNENEEDIQILIDSLLQNQIVAVLVQNVERLDESVKEESDGVHNTLAIIENVTEFRPQITSEMSRQGLMQWLLKRLKLKMPFDANKLYCSEILAILLQDNDDNRELVGAANGIDILLQQLAAFKRHDPASKEEGEMMENLFDAMCSCLMLTANRERFLKGEGLQLMNLMLREKKESRNSALKVLNHAMLGKDGVDNSNKFVDILGLRTVFPVFMKTPKAVARDHGPDQHEEHVCSVVASLLRNCQPAQRQRLVAKFVESDLEKVDRLVELHFKYLDHVHACDRAIEKEKVKLRIEGEIVDESKEEEFYLRRLDAGLFTLQLVDIIMLEICTSSNTSIKQRVMQILNLRGGSVKTIRNIMREYAGNVGSSKAEDEESMQADVQEQERILNLVDKF